MVLNHDEFDVLDKIAHKSGMDCWFLIRQDKNDEGHFYDYVYDIDECKQMSLGQGVKQLIDGCIDVNIDELTDKENFTLIKLLGELI